MKSYIIESGFRTIHKRTGDGDGVVCQSFSAASRADADVIFERCVKADGKTEYRHPNWLVAEVFIWECDEGEYVGFPIREFQSEIK